MKKKPSSGEVILWSIAFPGFGQFLNGSYFKGFLFVVLEFVLNTKSNFNLAIYYSFIGEIQKAIEVTNIQWLMFYPCIYIFSMWDAFRETEAIDNKEYLHLPFVFSAYSVTVGLMFSSEIKIFDVILGPVWLPMLFLIPGLSIGLILRKILLNRITFVS
jgi:hypothetical protein